MLKLSSHHVKHTLLAETISNICCALFDEKQECYGVNWWGYGELLKEKKHWNDPHFDTLRLKNLHPDK